MPVSCHNWSHFCRSSVGGILHITWPYCFETTGAIEKNGLDPIVLNFFFLIYVYKHCFLPLLFLFVMKCYVPNCIALCLATLVVVHFLHLCACFNCWSAHVSTHPLLAHHHLCYVDLYCVCTTKTIALYFFYLYYYLPFMYYICEYFLSPCFSCILCFRVNFVPDSFSLFGSFVCSNPPFSCNLTLTHWVGAWVKCWLLI